MALTEVRTLVETISTTELNRSDAVAIGRLLNTIWPKPGVDDNDRADKLQTDFGEPNAPAAIASRSFVIRDGDAIIAHAKVFPRTIHADGTDLTIAALAQVCTAPNHRGKNLGATIVKAALESTNRGDYKFSLFQTSPDVRPFYQRLGACVAENDVFDSTSDERENGPFWDAVVMRYPANRDGWPTGDIDLRGPGY